MWKFILIAALCLFQKSFPSTTPEYEYLTVSSDSGADDSSPDIPDIQRMPKQIFYAEMFNVTPEIMDYTDYTDVEMAIEESETGKDENEHISMLPELDYSLRNKQDNSVELSERENAASHDNKNVSELTLSSETTEDSSKGSKMNENIDSILTTETSKSYLPENVTGSSPSTEMISDDTALYVDLSNTTSASEIIEESKNTVIDTIHGINPDQNLTEEINSSFPTVSSATQRQSSSLKSPSYDDKSLSHPTVTAYESSRIYNKENTENITEEPFEHTPQDNNTYQSTDISEGIPPAEKSTFIVSSTNYDKLTTASLFNFDEFSLHTEIKDIAKTTENTEEITGGESDVSVELTSTPDITEPTTFVSIPEETEIPPTKQLMNQTYKLILKGNCSEDAFIAPIFQSLNSIFNNQLNAKNSTKLMKCEYVYELNFTSDIASPESFDEVINLIKEKISPDMEVSIVNYDSTIYQISHTTPNDSESFVVPKSMVYISSAATIAMLLFMIFIIICVRNKCRRHSTSLDLSDIPHLTLSVDDYKLAPIPRPSVSFPESNRDFLHAYSNETYNRTREDDTVLTQHHFSSNVGKAYDAASGQKDGALNQEMQTFTTRRCPSRNRSDLKSASAHEYSSADSWDCMKGRENGKKHGLDNPAFRRW